MVNFFGFFSVDMVYIVLGFCIIDLIIIITAIVLIVKIKKLANKYKEFMNGKDGKSMEDLILNKFNEIDSIMESNKKNETKINSIIKKLQYMYQKTGIVKYDAFNEMGGKLSFSLAMLDESNSGYIINSMHSREGCYTYIKEIVNGKSDIELGEEESEALSKAIANTGHVNR